MDNGRNFTTVVLWLSYIGLIIYLAELIGVLVIPVAAIVMVPLIVMMNFVWGNSKSKSSKRERAKSTEKRKRERVDTLLSDMSDDELFELRQRLQDGTFDEEDFYEHIVGDDGELVRR